MATSDTVFAGSIPDIYDRLLVPLIFEPYARDLAERVAATKPRLVLETAAGTGAVTRALAASLGDARIVATDLNQPMLDHAKARHSGNARIEWKQADALALPFEDQTFDVVVCQFGAMFFPDKVQGYREALRVLKPGGRFFFSVWDRTPLRSEIEPRNAPSLEEATQHAAKALTERFGSKAIDGRMRAIVVTATR